MTYGLLIILILLVVIAPSMWVKFVLWMHGDEIHEMPGTGLEFANHLIDRFQLKGVTVVKGLSDENYYSPNEKKISLEPRFYDGKSLSAIAVAAHEVGHAIQFVREEQVSLLRDKYLPMANLIQKTGVTILIAVPFVATILRVPSIGIFLAIVGIVTMLSSTIMYIAILPEEYDASFNKALPILEEGYVPSQYMPAIRKILRACAFTYVASALADILRLWRWLTLLK